MELSIPSVLIFVPLLYFCGRGLSMRGNRFTAGIDNNELTNNFQVNLGGFATQLSVGGTVSFPPLLNVTRRWKHTILVSVSISTWHNVALVGARSRFTQQKNNKLIIFRRSHVEGGKPCVVETLVQLHSSVIGWNLRQSSLIRHVYWSRRPHAPPRLFSLK